MKYIWIYRKPIVMLYQQVMLNVPDSQQIYGFEDWQE